MKSTVSTARIAASVDKRKKADCCFCGKGIWSRMVAKHDMSLESIGKPREYAHQKCAKGKEGEWIRAW